MTGPFFLLSSNNRIYAHKIAKAVSEANDVIPAKAGIHFEFYIEKPMDTRFPRV
jgi:hypothetical protein